MVWFALGWNPQNSFILLLLIQVACCGLFCIRLKSTRTVTFYCFLFKWRVVVCFVLGWNHQNSNILLFLIQVACCGLFCISRNHQNSYILLASYSISVLWFVLHWVEIPRTVTFCCFLFKWRVVVWFALDWNHQNSYILLFLSQVACWGLFCIR